MTNFVKDLTVFDTFETHPIEFDERSGTMIIVDRLPDPEAFTQPHGVYGHYDAGRDSENRGIESLVDCMTDIDAEILRRYFVRMRDLQLAARAACSTFDRLMDEEGVRLACDVFDPMHSEMDHLFELATE